MNNKMAYFHKADSFSNGMISERGARLDDRLVILPPQGMSKKLKLNRTEYTIKSNSDFSVTVMGTLIEVPSINEESFEFLLELQGDSRFLLRAMGGVPFKHNGTYSYCSYIERGDRVLIGFTELRFGPPVEAMLVCPKLFSDKRVARSGLSVLIQGETGTGKTTLAREIHELSGRSGVFVHLNLSAFSESLVESELFGHVKGAFTGAIKAKDGALWESNRGTLFLDEIDSLSLALQTKLLLFLDSKEFRAVGGTSMRSVDTRLIFASGQNLESLVEEGKIRKDFYYRLASGIEIKLPSLRNDRERIDELVHSFAYKNGMTVDRKLVKHYMKMNWPGNIRQLLSHLKRKSVLTEKTHLIIDQYDLELEKSDRGEPELQSLEDMKRSYAVMVYNKLGKSKKRALEVLKVSPPTLRALVSAVN